jgi:ATP-dependent Lhr-like helicase
LPSALDDAGPSAGGDGPSADDQDEIATRVQAALSTLGAAFLGSIARAADLSAEATLEALLRLTAAGQVANDTLAPIRLQPTPSGSSKARRLATLQRGTGRWSLTPTAADAAMAATYAQVLLQRYGVVTREVVQAEGVAISWGEVADVLRLMELRAQVRRGYFLTGLSGAQFAHPDAVERLRAMRDRRAGLVRLVAMTDPANPHGAIVPLPEEQRLARLPSSHLVLIDGAPVLACESYGKRLTPLAPLDDGALRQALGCLHQLLDGPAGMRRRRIEVESWDGEPATTSSVAPILEELGFQRGPWKYVLYR